ncbi:MULTISPECIES: helicase-related protein [unclassified Minwuia]|jgi:ATP-dependent RNA helicase SUPV3L1/SUV3|uniref:helicase-related protein n=1 Tax=unclassified Minwuia TaxID=2618799 RepID=UPI0024790671|nr:MULTISPECIES: helicase-related protein [unclassified Minwuia]
MTNEGISGLRGRTVALLGPTNTGKTHLAVETMLTHASGMMGFPLRLLAREVYDRVVEARGRSNVALVTGEEKIIPANPHYFLCTVEAMPTGRSFDFVAVDEIQLAADPERGHTFTDRLLHVRGLETTMFLGAATARGLIQRLLPDTTIITRPRLSSLAYVGQSKLSRLPRRSAVVAFSASDVYAIAELMRRQRGGAAVVLGALSPRTRNAQVEMYQAGEVDFLVATDAIGMGLNMDINHVAFAATHKFDGARRRALSPAEIGQIAGRAGRFMRDGTFGVTADAPLLEPELVEAVQEHRFDPLTQLRWRNTRLDFSHPKALIRSLEQPPPFRWLATPRRAEDTETLKVLARDPEIMALAELNPANMHLLWDICQVPDFRKTMHDNHVKLVGRIYLQIATKGQIDRDWMAKHLEQLDRTTGDLDTLQGRLAHIRTWTYISHRAAWLDDPLHWQERARAIEERLSDALHQSLTQRFVDRRTAALVNRLRDREEVLTAIDPDGNVTVEGQYVGRIRGLVFAADRSAFDNKALKGAVRQVLASALVARGRRIAGAADDAFTLSDDGDICWQDEIIARLEAGDHVLRPRVRLNVSDQLDSRTSEEISTRLGAWVETRIGQLLRPLTELENRNFSPAARGIAFQIVERLGILPRKAVQEQMRQLDPKDHGRFKYAGVQVGRSAIFCPALLKPEPTRWRMILHGLQGGLMLPTDQQGRVSFDTDRKGDADALLVSGYARFGTTAVRVDMVERIADHAHKATRKGPAEADHALMSMLGGGPERLGPILTGLGYRTERQGDDAPLLFHPRPTREQRKARNQARPASSDRTKQAPPKRKHRRETRPLNPDSPFAALAVLKNR